LFCLPGLSSLDNKFRKLFRNAPQTGRKATGLEGIWLRAAALGDAKAQFQYAESLAGSIEKNEANATKWDKLQLARTFR
jgi:hypothetical protein